MTDRLFLADASKVSPRDFASALGLKMRTKEQKEAEWRANVKRYADFIEAGNEWAVPPPYLADARREAALRKGIERELRFTVELQRKQA